ncbi:MAG: ABC transporter permease [Clostridia bacterium]|nr:ABC transporter permease [Clostridia bacterium]
MGEYFISAIDNIRSHKMRSMLTMLGIIIGIASIIAISSTIMGTNEQIKQNLVGAGNNTVTVQLSRGDYAVNPEYESIPEAVPVIDDATIASIRAIPEVAGAAVFTVRSLYEGVFHGPDSLSQSSVYGVDNEYFRVYGYRLRAGRTFTARDIKELRNVCILDRAASKDLFQGASPIGQTVLIKKVPFVVIGELAEPSSFAPKVTTLEEYFTYNQSSGGGKLFLPAHCWPEIFGYDEPQSVVARAVATDEMTEAGKQIAKILNGRFTGDAGDVKYRSEDMLKKAKELQELSQSTNRQLLLVASISLLVGGIGVMNIMLVSVTERTGEIGLKKALGATARTVSVQFLTEAGVLTCIGGIIGVLCGVGLAYAISRFSGAPIAISGFIIALSVVFSFAVGLFFGAFPAVKAAKLDPIEALRSL